MSDESTRFDRVPRDEDRGETPARKSILGWWAAEFDIEPAVFDRYTFWERGRGKLWLTAAPAPDPARVEALGMFCLRTRGHDWKPTTNAAQLLGTYADRRVIDLDDDAVARFVAGDDQPVEWDGPRGYVFVRSTIGGAPAVIGVGQHLDGRLRSTVPKPRRRELLPAGDADV